MFAVSELATNRETAWHSIFIVTLTIGYPTILLDFSVIGIQEVSVIHKINIHVARFSDIIAGPYSRLIMHVQAACDGYTMIMY